MSSEDVSNDTPVYGVLRLEPGHLQNVIDRMERYLDEERRKLTDLVRDKEFKEAFTVSVEIREVEFWIEGFKSELPDGWGKGAGAPPPTVDVSSPDTGA